MTRLSRTFCLAVIVLAIPAFGQSVTVVVPHPTVRVVAPAPVILVPAPVVVEHRTVVVTKAKGNRGKHKGHQK